MDFSTKDLKVNRGGASNQTAYLRAVGYFVACLLPLALGWHLTRTITRLIFANDSFSQILVAPLVSLFLVCQGRKRIFTAVSFDWVLGTTLIVPGSVLFLAARLNMWPLRPTNQAALFVFGVVLIWLGAFGLLFGKHAFRRARFPLLFLLFSVPIPEPILTSIVRFLQKESADAAEWLFELTGVPYLREDFVFRLPGVSIQVAEECSGIRSSLALLITAVLASYLFLRSNWRRLVLCAAVIPLSILKNGLRIATLSTLAIYVNPGFLSGKLHYRGGIVFFILALLPMALLLILLQKGERPTFGTRSGVVTGSAAISEPPHDRKSKT